MFGEKKQKLFILTVFSLALGFLVISGHKFLNKLSEFSQAKTVLAENNSAEVCPEKNADDNTSLYVSCAGFLE